MRAVTIQVLGKRHVDYGVKPEDDYTVGATLLWIRTLEQGLGAELTPPVRGA